VPAAVIYALFAAGCGSDPRPGPRGGATPPRRLFTPMAGQESFYDGKIQAEIHIGTEGMPEPQRGEGGGERRGGPGGGRRGGGGGGRMRMAGGPGGFGGDVSGSVPFGEGGRRTFNGPRPGAMGGGGRPVLIHLRFTNRTEAPLELTVSDFVSPLGNFVVRPEKLKLEPGESLEVEPMTSQLAGAFTETTATLALRLDGQAEKKAFPLKQVPVPATVPEQK
jgi:hypothetical protein